MRTLPVESASEATAPHQPSNVRQRCRAFQGAPKPWTNLCASCLSIPRWNNWHLMRVEAEAQRKEAWKKRQAEMKNSQCFTAHNIQSCGQTALRHGLGVWLLCVMATTFGSFWRHSWFVFKTQKGQWLCVWVCSLKAGWVWMGIYIYYCLARKETRNTCSYRSMCLLLCGSSTSSSASWQAQWQRRGRTWFIFVADSCELRESAYDNETHWNIWNILKHNSNV